jgi:hypothetical protein
VFLITAEWSEENAGTKHVRRDSVFQIIEVLAKPEGLQRIDNCQQRRKHADEESQLLTHYQSAKSDRVGALALLLLLELLDLLILSLDLRLLCRQLLLHGLVLLLPRLHLVADQGAAD